MVHTEVFNNIPNKHYGIRMNDTINVIISVNKFGDISCCGAKMTCDGSIVSDTNSSKAKIISESFAAEMIKTFGAYELEKLNYNPSTNITRFNFK